MRCNEISQAQFTLFLIYFLRIHLRLEISHVIHLLPQLLHADLGQLFVVDDRCFAHLMCIARETLVGFRSSIAGSSIVDLQLEFPEAHDFRILLLTQIIAEGTRRNGFVIRTFDVCLIQQVLILRHVLRRVAGSQYQAQKSIYAEFA